MLRLALATNDDVRGGFANEDYTNYDDIWLVDMLRSLSERCDAFIGILLCLSTLC